MPSLDESLTMLRGIAKRDPSAAARLLAASEEENPVDSFCRVSAALGCPILPMDLINAGEEYYAGMRRSTNGGGENSPLLSGADDYYELFIAELRAMAAPAGSSGQAEPS